MEWRNAPRRHGLVVAGALTLAGTISAGLAPAQAQTPQKDAATAGMPTFDFSDCPELPEGFDELGSICIPQVAVSGRLRIGRLSYEITDPIRFTMADAVSLAAGERRQLAGPIRAKPVPLDSAAVGLPPGRTVLATPEYAGPVSFQYPDFTIGVKIRLTGAGLGESCLIGDDDDPILLTTTTGTTNPPPPNTPISGVPFEFVGTQGKAGVRTATHVDNAFPVPSARGCTQNGTNIDPIVNASAGLPSPAGANTVVLGEYFAYLGYINLP